MNESVHTDHKLRENCFCLVNLSLTSEYDMFVLSWWQQKHSQPLNKCLSSRVHYNLQLKCVRSMLHHVLTYNTQRWRSYQGHQSSRDVQPKLESHYKVMYVWTLIHSVSIGGAYVSACYYKYIGLCFTSSPLYCMVIRFYWSATNLMDVNWSLCLYAGYVIQEI